MRRRAGWIGAAGVAAALLMVACGSSGGSSSTKAKPDVWAESVCSAVGGWVKDVQATAESFKSAVTDSTDAPAAKAKLSTFADDLIAKTDTMLAGVGGAGTPDVKDGAAIEKALNTELGTIKPVFEQLKSGIEALPTDSPASFVAGATALEGTISEGLGAFGESLGNITSPELEKAFEANAACQAVGS